MSQIFEVFSEQAKGALKGKVALITGAGRGCGEAIAKAYAAAGAAVCCVSRTSTEIEHVAKVINDAGGEAIAAAADVSDLAAVEKAVAAAVERFGGLDIVVSNHGVSLALATVENTDPVAWRQTIEINLIGAYHVARATVPALKARGAGKMIFVGSGQGHQGTATTSAYAASKAGVLALMQSLAAELVTFNISVNELLPGNVRTRLYEESVAKVQAAAPAGQKLSDKRSHEWLKEPEDVVPLALFLACQPDVGPTAQTFSLMRRF